MYRFRIVTSRISRQLHTTARRQNNKGNNEVPDVAKHHVGKIKNEEASKAQRPDPLSNTSKDKFKEMENKTNSQQKK